MQKSFYPEILLLGIQLTDTLIYEQTDTYAKLVTAALFVRAKRKGCLGGAAG